MYAIMGMVIMVTSAGDETMGTGTCTGVGTRLWVLVWVRVWYETKSWVQVLVWVREHA